MKAAKSLALTLGVFSVCWMPVVGYDFYLAIHNNSASTYFLMEWFYLLAYCNSGMNFVIYSVKNPDFKRSLKKLFGIKTRNAVSDFGTSGSLNETSFHSKQTKF